MLRVKKVVGSMQRIEGITMVKQQCGYFNVCVNYSI